MCLPNQFIIRIHSNLFGKRLSSISNWKITKTNTWIFKIQVNTSRSFINLGIIRIKKTKTKYSTSYRNKKKHQKETVHHPKITHTLSKGYWRSNPSDVLWRSSKSVCIETHLKRTNPLTDRSYDCKKSSNSKDYVL